MSPPETRASLMMLTPSVGFINGIERVADAVADAWPGPVARSNLYRAERERVPSGNVPAKVRFTAMSVLDSARSRPDQVLSLHLGLLPAAMAVAAAGRAQLSVLVHGDEGWAPASRTTRLALSRCDRVVATTGFSAHWFARAARMDRDDICVVPLPVDRHLVEAADRGPYPVRPAEILSVSRIEARQRYKGLFLVANSLPAVLEQRPDARWVVVGEGDDQARLKRHCHELGIGNAVDFRGGVTDAELVDAYRSASLFVLPSVADPTAKPPHGEGFGLVYAEAGIFGVPSIASTASGGASEFVREGETGMTTPPHDARALANTMLKLIEHGSLRERLGRNARALALARHTPEHFTDALSSALLD